MSKLLTITRDLPCDDSYDVIVAGGGPAGCTAAAAAARAGARTLLLEATCALGGMGTSGLVPAWCPFTDKERIIYGGMAEGVLKECMAGMAHVPPDRFDWTPIDSERLKRVYDDLVSRHGVTVRFQSTLAGVEMDQAGGVRALLVANKSGLGAFAAPVYVDCTGDADLSVWAGAPFEKGDTQGEMQPATHCFTLSNVDTDGYRHGPRFSRETLVKIQASGRYPLLKGCHTCNNLVGPGTVGFNTGHIWDVDNTDPASLSAAVMQGRKLAVQFRDALAEFLPQAFANAHLVATGALLGVRETRRIVGDYVLTLQDYLARRTFADEICRNSYPVDVHAAKHEIEASQRGEVSGMSRCEHYRAGESHGIPYRCLLPTGLRNVLVAGRAISTERLVQGSTRVMPVCLAMGEAAGVAAAIAARAAAPDVHQVDTDEVRRQLRAAGAYLP